jgi:hypothetical protein
MQVTSTGRQMLFSVWNPTNGTTTATRVGPGVVSQTFSGEGDGAQTYLIFPWVAGNTYKFLTEAQPDGAGNTDFTSWFYAPETGAWYLMAILHSPNTISYFVGAYSFIENFDYTQGFALRKALFGNRWAYSSGAWNELTQAYYDGDDTAIKGQRLDYAGGVSGNDFSLQHDGFFASFVALNQTFTRPAGGLPPNVDFSKLP